MFLISLVNYSWVIKRVCGGVEEKEGEVKKKARYPKSIGQSQCIDRN
jgi:hypothetical protein